jgi:hypothetical protein
MMVACALCLSSGALWGCGLTRDGNSVDVSMQSVRSAAAAAMPEVLDNFESVNPSATAETLQLARAGEPLLIRLRDVPDAANALELAAAAGVAPVEMCVIPVYAQDRLIGSFSMHPEAGVWHLDGIGPDIASDLLDGRRRLRERLRDNRAAVLYLNSPLGLWVLAKSGRTVAGTFPLTRKSPTARMNLPQSEIPSPDAVFVDDALLGVLRRAYGR